MIIKNMDDAKKIEIFGNNIVTLEKTSYDKEHDEYMTESQLKVISFDCVKEEYAKALSVTQPSSSGAFFVNREGKMFLIEFKNGKIIEVVKGREKVKKEFTKQMRLKIGESLLLLTDILSDMSFNISYTRKYVNYILVYNEDKNPSLTKIKKSLLSGKAKEEYIRFGFESFKILYFKNVFTLTESEFEEKFVQKWEKPSGGS